MKYEVPIRTMWITRVDYLVTREPLARDYSALS